jgi:hypothetical protein
MKFCVRIDDIGFRPHYELDAELCLAQALHKIFAGRPYLAAVIPGILDDVGADWIRSRPENMTPALHGWKHAKGVSGADSEFENMDEGLCRSLIEQGLQIINRVIDFVPPFNAVTPELLNACSAKGLATVWGQPYDSPRPFPPELKPWGIYVPSWLPTYGLTLWRASDVRRPVCEVMRENLQGEGVAVVVLHLTWEASFSPELRGVRALIDEFGDQLISPEQYIKLAGIAE